MSRPSWLLLCILLGGRTLQPVCAAEPPTDWLDRIDLRDLKRHASFLASDTLEGRQAGARGGQAAAAYLVSELKRLGLSPAGSGGDYRQSFGTQYCNVLAQRTGADPDRRGDLIVIGAHYDHVGFGNASNSYGPFGVIHNGADDNASGVAALLEVAQALAHADMAPARTIVFAFWDGEEVALLGSQHWVSSVPPQAVKLAINLDMIGRLRSEGVQIMGWRSAAGLRTELARANLDERLPFEFGYAVTPDSDHFSFYRQRIPVLHFDTGKHPDYHRPSDDVEHLNWEGLQSIARVVARLIVQSANADQLPAFRHEAFRETVPAARSVTERRSPPVRFGFTWRSSRIKEGIVEIDQVVPGLPAAQIGLQPGDRLLRFGRWEQGTLDELRTEITTAPTTVTVAWQRPGGSVPMTASVELHGEPVRWGADCRTDPALPGCLVVTAVTETSPADRLGLLPQDVVLSVDDRPASESEWRTLPTFRHPFTLTLERSGQMRQLTANAQLTVKSQRPLGSSAVMP